jgi:hypothetical protein
MRSTNQRSLAALAVVATMALGACSGMTPRERDTAVGGVIGTQVGKRRHER